MVTLALRRVVLVGHTRYKVVAIDGPSHFGYSAFIASLVALGMMESEKRLLNKELKEILADRLEGWELVDFLQIDIDTVIDAFEDEIEENLEDVLEFAGIKGLDNNIDETD